MDKVKHLLTSGSPKSLSGQDPKIPNVLGWWSKNGSDRRDVDAGVLII